MVRLSKGETNELLCKVSEDNYVYGLIFKLIYLYGKDGISVLSLKWNDINFGNDTILFKGYSFPLSLYVKEDLQRLSENSNGEYCFLDNVGDMERSIDIYRKRLRYYLNNTVKRLDVSHKIKHVALSITDLRRLRGQHLFLDGVGLPLIMELYLQGDGTVTQFKRYLEFDDLMESVFPCEDMVELFSLYSCLDVFDFDSSGVVAFGVSYGDGVSFVVYVSDGELFFVDEASVDSGLVGRVRGLFSGGWLDSLFVLGEFEFLSVGGFSFVKL